MGICFAHQNLHFLLPYIRIKSGLTKESESFQFSLVT